MKKKSACIELPRGNVRFFRQRLHSNSVIDCLVASKRKYKGIPALKNELFFSLHRKYQVVILWGYAGICIGDR